MTTINSAKDVFDFVKGELMGKDVEHCYALTLLGNTIKSLHWVAMGSEDACVIPKKVIARHAVCDLANGVILIHNHPSGNVEPSTADIRQTESLAEMLKVLETRLVDHVIVGGDAYYSFSDMKTVKVKQNGK